MFCPKCGVENLNTSRFCKKCGRQLPVATQIRQATQSFVGQVLDGKYRIDGKIGSGGMGNVYRATRLLIGDSVAIKVLHPHLARDPQSAERFRREAVAATQLRHRNVVALYDVGIAPPMNVPFILMEMAEGFSLRQIMDQYRLLPLDFVVTATAQVCAALEEAHRLGIVHRDIKPENIIANYTSTGWHIKVLDFGIAKIYNQADDGLTQDGSAMGTPQYMSPEQCMGEQLDGRSDLYSLGIMIYEMLSGTVPFKAPVPSAVAVHHVQTMPAPPSSHNPQIAAQVENVVMRILSKRREDRPQSAQVLSQELISAATEAFKAGLADVSATPIAAPDVKREFDAQIMSTSNEVPVAQDERASVAEKAADPGPGDSDSPVAAPAPAESTSADPSPEALPESSETDSTAETAAESRFAAEAEAEAVAEAETDREAVIGTAADEDLSEVFDEVEHLLDDLAPQPGPASEVAADSTEPASVPDVTAAVPVPEPIRLPDPTPETSPNSPVEPVGASLFTSIADPPAGLDDPQAARGSGTNPAIIVAAALLAGLVVIAGAVGVYVFVIRSAPGADSPSANVAKTETPGPPAGMVLVPGGEFTMGSDDGGEFSRPAHKVSVKPFYIDEKEVTNEDFKKFVDSSGYKAPAGWNGANYPDGKARLPVTGVDWDAAVAYAKWRGCRLPTEEEWEFAARGGDGRRYPWGNEFTPDLANVQSKALVEVGTKGGKSPFGLYDMSGNAWEWTATDSKAYPNGKMPYSESNEPKIIRGGYYGSSPETVTTYFRVPYGARGEKGGYANSGFRCAKSAE